MTNAPSTYVTLINSVFWPLIGKSEEFYIDKTIVSANQKDQHKLELKMAIKPCIKSTVHQNVQAPIMWKEPGILGACH